MVPPAAVLVDGDDDHHVRPLRTLLEVLDHVGDVRVARGHIRIARMHVQVALRLVEADGGQGAGIDGRDEMVGFAIVAHAGVQQVPGAGRRARRVGAEIVEGLVVVLEVGLGPVALMRQRRVPGAGVPSPGHALVAQPVADRRVALRRHDDRVRRIGQQRIAAGRGPHVARLIRRRHRVDAVAIGREAAVLDVQRHAVDRGLGRIGRDLQVRAHRVIAVQHADQPRRGAVGCVGIERRLRGHEVDVVEPGTTEGRHEEAVAQRVLARHGGQLHLR